MAGLSRDFSRTFWAAVLLLSVAATLPFSASSKYEKSDKTGFRALLKYPNYRATIYPGQPKALKIGLELNSSSGDFFAKAFVINSAGKTILTKSAALIRDTNIQEIEIALPEADSGAYRVVLSLQNSDRSELASAEVTFSIASAQTPLPKVYMDRYNRCVVDGKLFFPLGFYTSGSAEKDWDQIASMGFNCILDYGIMGIRPISELKNHLSQINARKLKVIFCLKGCYEIVPNQRLDPVQEIEYGEWNGAYEVFKGLVINLKDHPAILAWYINDELTAGYLPQITQRYNYIKSSDPDHPAYQVLNTVEDPDLHLKCSDITGFDVYPVLYQCEQKLSEPQLSKTARATLAAYRAGMGSRAVWMVPECSSQKSMTAASRPPTYEEALCETYLALINGARGLIYYHYYEMSRDDGEAQVQIMKKLAQNLHSIEPVILGIDAPASKSAVASDKRINVLTRITDSGIYALAANPLNQQIECDLSLGSEMPPKTVVSGAPGTRQRSITVSDGKFSDVIEPFGVRVYRLSER